MALKREVSLVEETLGKWKGILDHSKFEPIKDRQRRSVTAVILENTEQALEESAGVGARQYLLETQGLSQDSIPVNFMGASSSTTGAGGIDTFDPILISLVRRALPQMIAYDVCGVQPMTGPTGLIFALRSRYSNQTGGEAFYNEVNTAFATIAAGNSTIGQSNGYLGSGGLPGNTTSTSNLAGNSVYNYAQAMATAQAEALGTAANAAFAEMAFTIEKQTVTAQSRALKAEYTLELAQDLKAVHGLDAETELTNILTTEILAEINREVVRTIYVTAVPGAQYDTTTAGVFDMDTDSNGRWSVEKFKGLMFYLERECNRIARDTRRGKGNIMICSSDVASALQMAGVLSYTPNLDKNGNMVIDDTGSTFVGVLNGRIKVYIDPYVTLGNFAVVGYKGSNAFDAGLFYCPYVPLQMVRAVDQESFHPKIGFKTRYGMVANPFAQGLTKGLGALVQDSNLYYRRTIIVNLM